MYFFYFSSIYQASLNRKMFKSVEIFTSNKTYIWIIPSKTRNSVDFVQGKGSSVTFNRIKKHIVFLSTDYNWLMNSCGLHCDDQFHSISFYFLRAKPSQDYILRTHGQQSWVNQGECFLCEYTPGSVNIFTWNTLLPRSQINPIPYW